MDFMGVQPGENGDEMGFILWFWLIVYELEVMAHLVRWFTMIYDDLPIKSCDFP
jgi:hypothetical protein